MSEKGVSTWYDGYLYRSKLEAMTAAYLHINQIEYKNEDCYPLRSGTYYKPDFHLTSDEDFFIEAKGDHQWTEDGMKKVEQFAFDYNIIVFGKEWPRSIIDLQNQWAKDKRFFSNRYIEGINGDECTIIIGGSEGYIDVSLPLVSDLPGLDIYKEAEEALSFALNTAYKHIQGLRDQDPTERIRLTDEEMEIISPLWEYANNLIYNISGSPAQKEEEKPVEHEESNLRQIKIDSCVKIINDYLEKTGIPAQQFARRFFEKGTPMGTVGAVISRIRKGDAPASRTYLYSMMAEWIIHFGNADNTPYPDVKDEQSDDKPDPTANPSSLSERVRRDRTMFKKLRVLLSVYNLDIDDLALKLLKAHVVEKESLINEIESLRGTLNG